MRRRRLPMFLPLAGVTLGAASLLLTISDLRVENEHITKSYEHLVDEYAVLSDDFKQACAVIVEKDAELAKFVNPIQYNRNTAPTYDVPLSEELQEYTYSTCSYYGIEDYYETILAMMWRESNFDPDAISSTGDYGIMQINSCNHEYLRDTLGFVDIMDINNNIESGVYIMSNLLNEYEDTSMALMAYNMGPNNASEQWRRGNYTSAYSRDVASKAELIKLNQYSK